MSGHEAPDGRDIYFHRNSVTAGRFADLKAGVHVRFTEAVGDKGPQASAVAPVETKRVSRALK